MITRAGQDDDPYIVVSGRLFEGAVQFLEQGGRLRIAILRAVQNDARDPILFFEDDDYPRRPKDKSSRNEGAIKDGPGEKLSPQFDPLNCEIGPNGCFKSSPKFAKSLRIFEIRARSSTGQSIGLRIRPSHFTLRDTPSLEETGNPCAPKVSCVHADPVDSSRISRNRRDSGRKCPTYAQLFWARRGRVLFKSPMLSGSRMSWAQVGARTRGNASSMTLRRCRLLARAATSSDQRLRAGYRSDRQC